MLICCYNRDLPLVQSHKLEAEVREGVGRSQYLVALCFEVRVGAGFVAIATWPLSKIRSWKSELVRLFAEVNSWLGCFLKCESVLLCCYNRDRSKNISWKPKFVRELAEVNIWLLCALKCGSVL